MKSVIRDVLQVALLAFVIYFAISFTAQEKKINGTSMEPGLHDGEVVLVSKVVYWFGRGPGRGDIVIYKSSSGRVIIHRVVGLPGESVQVVSGNLFINGQKVEESYIQGGVIALPLQVVPQDSYFIVGDNRFNALGEMVPRRNILGKAWVVVWPPGAWGRVPNYAPASYGVTN